MADPFIANKQTQFGVESTSGIAVPANRQLPTLTIDLDENFNVQKFAASGHRFDSVVVPGGDEYSTGKLGGGVTYTELVYPFSMIWGAGVITTPAGGVNARQWKWTPPLTGRVNPKSMTIEQGDADDSERVAYAILSDISLDLTRAQNQIGGSLIAKALEKANSGSWVGMTSSPTTIALNPVLPKNWDAFMDTVPASLGTTRLTRAFKATMNYGGAFLPYFPMDSTVSSYAGIADSDQLSAVATLELVKDAVGEGLWTYARSGKKLYVRLRALGDLVDNYFTSASGSGTGGNISFTYKGVTSANIAYSSGWSASAIQTALQAMSTIGSGNVSVTGGPLPGTPVVITFIGALATDTALLTMTTSGVTGGTLSNTLTATQIQQLLQIDYAASIVKPGPTAGNQGLRVRQWDFDIVEDSTLGYSMTVTLVNSLTAL